MGKLTPMQEATHALTPEVRLLALATGANPEVRWAAQKHPRLGQTFRQLLAHAEDLPDLLTPEDLAWLSEQGPFGAEVAATHPHTPEAALRRLVMAGHARAVLKRGGRNEEWLLALAREDRALLAYLGRDYSVPWGVRRRAQRLDHARPGDGPKADGPEAVQVIPPPVGEVRARLRNRHEAPTLSAQEEALLWEDRALGRLAARHPLLPVPLLERLDAESPHGQARETLLHRLEHHDLGADLLARLAREGDWEVRAALARNVHLPAFLLPYLVEDPDWWVRASVAEHPDATPEQLAALAREHEHAVIREHVAGHPHTPADLLADLAGDGEGAVRLQVARNPSTPPGALARLAADGRYAVREAVAAHPLTPPEVVVALLQDPNERVALVARLRALSATDGSLGRALATRRRNVKLAVAAHALLPGPLLASLARDRSPQVRARAGLHPGLPDAERRLLQEDADLTVRRVARAADPGAPPQVLLSLPRHDARIRQGLSRNGATPASVLEQLSDDPLEEVRLSVVLNPASPAGALQRRLPEPPLRPSIRQHPLYGRVQPELHRIELGEAEDPAASPDHLAALSESDAPGVRRRVALHPQTPDHVLLTLARDPLEEVRRSLTGRGDLAADVQAVLALDGVPTVREGLLRRPDLPPQVMLTLAQRPDETETSLGALIRHPQVTQEVLSVLARHPRAEVRGAVAQHERTPVPVQVRLASDPHDRVASSLLANPACGPEVLAALARHPRLRPFVAEHGRTSPDTLEALAFDAGYSRLLRIERLLRRVPSALKAPADQWVRWLNQRASSRAYPSLRVLAAVIRHPAATPRAVRFASRLNHPEILAARQDRKAHLQVQALVPPEAASE